MLKLTVRENLYIKQAEEKEAQNFFDFIHSNRTFLKKWLNWVDFIQNVEDEKNYIKSCPTDIKAAETIAMGIWYNHKVIGTMGFLHIDKPNKNGLMGYCMDEKYQGQGIMTDCCKKLIEYSFIDLDLHKIELRIVEGNTKSISLAKRLGFIYETTIRENYLLDGEFKNCEIHSMLKSEFEKLQ